MDLTFRTDAIQAEAQWFGTVRLAQVEIFRGSGFPTRGEAQTQVKVEFAQALQALLARPTVQNLVGSPPEG